MCVYMHTLTYFAPDSELVKTRKMLNLECDNIPGSCSRHLRHTYTSTYAHMEWECVHIHTPWHTSQPSPSYQTQQYPWFMSLTLEVHVHYNLCTHGWGMCVYIPMIVHSARLAICRVWFLFGSILKKGGVLGIQHPSLLQEAIKTINLNPNNLANTIEMYAIK